MSHFASNMAYGQEDVDHDDMIEHIRTANSHKYHLDLITPSTSNTTVTGERCSIECKWGTTCNTTSPQLTTNEKLELFALFEYNMKDMYSATCGWNRHEKESYLLASRKPSYFLLIKNNQDKIIGFCLYSIEWDDEDEPEEPVLYCDELQVSRRYLLDAICNVKKIFKLSKIVMTCFKCNEKAFKFYTANNYIIDSSSPSRYGVETDYEILSRK